MNRTSAKLFLSLIIALTLTSPRSMGQRGFPGSYISTNLDMESGLPSNFIDDIYRDNAGFVWVATSGGGLCRYDWQFLNINQSVTGSSLKSLFVNKVAEDNFHRLWIASTGGLDILDMHSMTLGVLSHPKLDQIIGEFCSYVTADALGNIWFKTGKSLHMVKFSPSGDVSDVLEFTHDALERRTITFKDVNNDGSVWVSLAGEIFSIREKFSGKLEASRVLERFSIGENTYLSDIFVDGSDIWMTTEEGLYRINRISGQWKRYVHRDNDPKSLTQNFLTGIVKTPEGTILISSLYGLNIYNSISDNFERFGSQVVNCMTLIGNNIILGSETSGIFLYSPKRLDITNFSNSPGVRSSLARGSVNSVGEDSSGRIWVGVVEGGVNISESGSGSFTHLTHEGNGLSHNSISALESLPGNRMAVGTWGGGTDIVSEEDPFDVIGQISDPDHLLDFTGSLEYDNINSLLWIGSNQGIFFYDLENETLSPALSSQTSGCIGSLMDSKGRLWMGSQEGVFAFDLNKRNPDGSFPFKNYRTKLDDPESGIVETISCILEASDGTIYLGSNGGGLYYSIPGKEDVFGCHNSSSGLSNDRVRGICEDGNKRIWISTEYGLNMLDPASGKISQFFNEDGLDGTQFYWNSSFKGTDGKLYFGHTGGLSVVEGLHQETDSEDDLLRITEIRIGQKRMFDPFIDKLILHEKDRSIEIAFALLSPNADRYVTYEYIMDGLGETWTRLPRNHHEATFTTLPSGRYTFKVRAIRGEEIKTLEIPVRVRPYFYRTWWFTLNIIALAILGVYLYTIWKMRSMIRQREILEQTVKQRTEEISQQRKIVEQKAEELDRQNKILRRQNEELASRKILFSQPKKETDEPDSDKFAEKALSVIRELYKDPDLDVGTFCESMGMSKTNLNLRIQEAFGQSIGQFIRKYRLSVAQEMMQNDTGMNISEIAYEVGFNDPKYFTRCFSKEFGTSPSAFLKE
ncbi:MAG: helix-turn-helix domain-containing protein [Bacteroidales bacterium]|nr:helix-turn-helix domain-containing protein [Bacteroidales bacterium]